MGLTNFPSDFPRGPSGGRRGVWMGVEGLSVHGADEPATGGGAIRLERKAEGAG